MQKLLWGLIFLISQARATTERSHFFPDSTRRDLFDQEATNALESTLPPQEAFRRTQWVLNALHVPAEPDSAPAVTSLAGHQTVAGYRSILRIMDPSSVFTRLLSRLDESAASQLPASVPLLSVFQDQTSRATLDFQVRLAQDHVEPVLDPAYFHNRLLDAQRENPSDRPLRGLRIALDPGHMGGDFWDRRTGKYIVDPRGRRLSEGVMALQTALLLEQKWTALGAEVLLTRRDLVPVTPVRFRDFSPADYGDGKLREAAHDRWFLALLNTAEPGPSLLSAFTRSSLRQALYSEGRRDQYFILDIDLNARSQMIRDFNPDIALVIHFDTGDVPGHSTAINYEAGVFSSVKAYVTGAVSLDELATREDRKYFALHALDSDSWNASLNLGRNIVHSMSSQLHLPFGQYGGGQAVHVEPGIFARNLEVSRKIPHAAVSYLECLHYNDAHEFDRLIAFNHTLRIGETDYGYSDRLVAVAESINQGVLGFVRDYH